MCFILKKCFLNLHFLIHRLEALDQKEGVGIRYVNGHPRFNIVFSGCPLFGVLQDFDGAVKDGQVVANYIKRNYLGALILAGGKKLSYCIIPYAKLIRTWFGLCSVLYCYN